MNQRKVQRVRDVMRDSYVVVPGMATVEQAIARMREVNAEMVLVEKRHADDERGLVLASDIARQVIARDRSARRVNVYEIMTKPVLSVRSDMDVRYCARLFERFQLYCAPVLDDGDIVGVVTYTDMVLGGDAS